MKQIYTIKDTVMDECNAPFIANNDAHARMIYDRSIENARKAGFKQEFKLFYLGSFDEQSGKIFSKDVPAEVSLISVVEAADDQKELFD